MTTDQDDDLKAWAADWQAAPHHQDSAEQIRRYVSKRSGLLWSFAVVDFAVGGLALPVLLYLGLTTRSDVEQLAMISLASITIATVIFGWWNRRGVLRSTATTIADYVGISAERLRRMRMALRLGWVVGALEVVFFSIWIADRLYSGSRDVTAGEAQFAWAWLTLFTVGAAAGLVAFGRWLDRDTARFEALKAELEATTERAPHPRA
jgi:hypothetical protein